MLQPTYPNQPWHEIIPNLWMGGHDYGDLYDPTPAIVAGEFDSVVSLYQRDGHGPDAGIPHTVLRIIDGDLDDNELDTVRSIADRVADDVRDGRKVLVRCQAGLNRSGLVVAFTLTRLGFTPHEAIRRIRRQRSPHALFNAEFVRYILHEGGVRA
ncbi:dual specificity protein phosphatase family protein [Micromonospora lupini]|uniref:protein-tyrosine phosphatase family protein n=1 Tax=Micromonospora lupini TaxID=285679 RepID=UPI002259B365|nr:dual specificity protein phosphatase family protein [Micromonospora lupini]MCX5070875.1 dual specificity protein phosphatase family protein [Micromonospora lupini]